MRRIKNFFTEEIGKLKKMNFTEKRQYLWEYYKLEFIIALILIIFTYGFLDIWVFNPAKDEVVTIAWLAETETQENLDDIKNTLTPLVVTDPEKETVTVYDFSPSANVQLNMAKSQQFTALLTTGDLDLFIVNGWQAVSDVALIDYAEPLDLFLDELKTRDASLYKEVLPLLTEGEFTSVPDEYETEIKTVSGLFAIPLTGSSYFSSRDFISKDLFLCLSATMTEEDYPDAVKTLQALFT